MMKGGPFDLPAENAPDAQAAAESEWPPNSDVVKRRLGGRDITSREGGGWLIDFGVNMSEQGAALYEWMGVGNDPRYSSARTFDTFPHPSPPGTEATDARVQAIAEAARTLARLRDARLKPPGTAEAELPTRTLTNLCNARPTWLANAHQASTKLSSRPTAGPPTSRNSRSSPDCSASTTTEPTTGGPTTPLPRRSRKRPQAPAKEWPRAAQAVCCAGGGGPTPAQPRSPQGPTPGPPG